MEAGIKLYVRFALLGFLLGAFVSVYSQLHTAQVSAEAQTIPPPDGSGGVLSALICGILGAICGMAAGFLTRLLVSLWRHAKSSR